MGFVWVRGSEGGCWMVGDVGFAVGGWDGAVGGGWFFARAKPGMSSKRCRPTSWAGITGSSSSSRFSMGSSLSKRLQRCQHGFPTLVRSWAGIRGSSFSSGRMPGLASSSKSRSRVRQGAACQSGEHVAQAQCRVDSPVA